MFEFNHLIALTAHFYLPSGVEGLYHICMPYVDQSINYVIGEVCRNILRFAVFLVSWCSHNYE